MTTRHRHTHRQRPLDELVEQHLWLAEQAARQIWHRFPRHVDRNELYAAALLGLTEAASRFDPTLGVPFPAYATARVRGAVLEVARAADLVPRRLRRDIRDVVDCTERLTHVLGRRPTVHEIAEHLHLDAAVVRRRLADLDRSAVTSLDVDGVRAHVPIDDTTDPYRSVFHREADGTIREAVERLPEPLRSIVIRTHWHDDRLIDIAADMGVSFQRVAQYKVEAIRTLAAWLSMIDDDVTAPADGLPGSTRRTIYCDEMLRDSSWRTRFDRGLDDAPPITGSRND